MTGPVISGVACLLSLLLFFLVVRQATADTGYAASLTLLVVAANGLHEFPVRLFAAVLFLSALTLVRSGWLRPIAIGIAHGLATLIEVVALVAGIAAIDAVFRASPETIGTPLRPTTRRRVLAGLVYATAFLSAGLILLLWPPLDSGVRWGFLNLSGFLWGMAHGGAPIWNGWQALIGAAESILLAAPPLPVAAVPAATAAALAGLRTLLRALIVGLLIGPLFSRPQTDLSGAGRMLARGSILYLAAMVPAWLLIGSWRANLAVWTLPPLLALTGIAYSRSHPAGRIAGHNAIVGVIAGIAALLGLHNLLSRLAF